jgi:hypothetical protein
MISPNLDRSLKIWQPKSWFLNTVGALPGRQYQVTVGERGAQSPFWFPLDQASCPNLTNSHHSWFLNLSASRVLIHIWFPLGPWVKLPDRACASLELILISYFFTCLPALIHNGNTWRAVAILVPTWTVDKASRQSLCKLRADSNRLFLYLSASTNTQGKHVERKAWSWF